MWQQSGLSQKAFCSQHKVAISTFQYWVSKYRKASEQSVSGFVALPTHEPASAEITYPNGVRIRVAGLDPAHIAQLIHLW